MEQQSDNSSIASSSSNGPATATAPPRPPEALQLKKMQCCNLFLHLQAQATLSVSPVSPGCNCWCGQAVLLLTQKIGLHFCLLKGNEKLHQEGQQILLLPQGIRKPSKWTSLSGFPLILPRTSDRVTITSICAMHGPKCQLHTTELQTVLKEGGSPFYIRIWADCVHHQHGQQQSWEIWVKWVEGRPPASVSQWNVPSKSCICWK